MASAACSSTCMAGGEFFSRRRAVLKEMPSPKLSGGDITASFASFHSHLCVTWKKHLFFGKEKCLESVWMNFQPLRKTNCKEQHLERHCRLISKAVATIQQYCFIPSESEHINDSSIWFDSNTDSQMESSNSCPESEEEREKLRRMRISKANKGNIPWNKGRKHTPETVQRIRERTKLAMQDPKVKLKLMNLGHAQSDATKKKIALGVRQGWERRRGILTVQESCLLEWKNNIAESSRKGYAGEVELQWDSHEIMTEQLKQLWLESIEKWKSMPRPKGSKRAPKSLEQRRKISEAISAKWADPDYRNRVQAALSKYHGSTFGNERKTRRRSTSGILPNKKVTITKKPAQVTLLNCEEKVFKQSQYIRRKNPAPSYKDPMSCANLELLKKIKAERAELEAKKSAAIMRAKLLIAEAERAAEALEAAALKSPLAKASLLETRRLIAEATCSIQSIESGHLMPQGTTVKPYSESNFDGSKKLLNEAAGNEQLVNGFHTVCSAQGPVKSNQHRMGYELNGSEVGASDLVSRKLNNSKSGSAIRKKMWVCGRLVEVDV